MRIGLTVHRKLDQMSKTTKVDDIYWGNIDRMRIPTGYTALSQELAKGAENQQRPTSMDKAYPPHPPLSDQDEKCQYEWLHGKAMSGTADDLSHFAWWWHSRNRQEALLWFKKAAVVGDAEAMH